MRKLLAASGVLVVCLASAAQAGNEVTDAKNAYPKSTDTVTCSGGDTITFYGAHKLWPPNHKWRTVTITVKETHAGPFSFSTTTTSNEGPLDPGSGHTPLDATPATSQSAPTVGPGSQSQDIMLRAERDGGGTGRTYTIAVDAKFDGGANECKTSFTVVAPHDMRGGAKS